MSTLNRRVARVFEPLLAPARYKGAYGGRGSGKSHFFAEQLIDEHLTFGVRSVCIRENQRSLKESAKKLIEDKLEQFNLGVRQGFKVFKEVIETPGDGIILFQGMRDHTAESIKSLENFSFAWVEEAQTLSATSLMLLRPTIRAPGSQIWFSWNPRHKHDPVDIEMRQVASEHLEKVVVKANWADNPWWTPELEAERLDCLQTRPEQYEHIWEGDYVSTAEGAYYAEFLAQAALAGRIGTVSADPVLPVRMFIDIGGTGAKSDAFAMWAAQFVGREIRVLDYYEVVGQPLAAHLAWMRSNGYPPDVAEIVLPHDGSTNDRVYDVSYETAFRGAGYKVTVIPNQGRGAASARIQAVRRLFPAIWFNEQTTQAGREALGWYHERRCDVRNVGLGPEHDWSSHGADAFGLMAVAYKPPRASSAYERPEINRSRFE